MNRTQIAIAALLSLGAATQAAAQAQAQPSPNPVATPPVLPSGGGSLTTNAQVTGSITQTAAGFGGGTPGFETVDIASIVGLTGTPGSVTTRGTLIGGIAQTRSPGNTDPLARQLVQLGSVHGAVQAASVQTDSLVQGNITQNLQLAESSSPSARAEQVVEVGSISGSSGQSLRTNSTMNGNIVQSQTRTIEQQLRLGSIRGATVQDALAGASVTGAITQLGTTGAGGGSAVTGRQHLSIGAIDGVRAQSVTAVGVASRNINQTQNGQAQQRIEVGSVLDTGTGVGASAGTLRGSGFVAGVSQFADGQNQQTLAVGRVLDSTASHAFASGAVTRDVTQFASGSDNGGIQFIGVGSIDLSSGNVETDAVVDATLTQTRSSTGGTGGQRMGIGTAVDTAGTVRTRARVVGTVAQSSSAGQNIEQKIEIGSVSSTSANVSTDAFVSGNILQSSSSGTSFQQQAIRVGSVTAN